MRFRLWVGGELADEVWIDSTNPDADALMARFGTRQGKSAAEAAAAGRRWLVEVYDPALPEDHAYLRFGTDDHGMRDPVAVQPGDLERAASRLARQDPPACGLCGSPLNAGGSCSADCAGVGDG
jgi:hypothetical protein